MTKLRHRRNGKLGRLTSDSSQTWRGRSTGEIQADLKVISDHWEGTRSDRQAWGALKTELQTARLEEARLAAVAKRKQEKA